MRNKFKFIGIAAALAGSVVLSVYPAFADEDPILDPLPTPPSTTPSTTPSVTPSPTSSSIDGGRFICRDDSTGKEICKRSDGSVAKRLADVRQKDRQLKIEAIGRIYQAEITRAQNAIDRLQNIIDRIQAQRPKLTNLSSDDAATLDGLITTAESQKQAAVAALADVKAKADAIKATLTSVKTDTMDGMDTTTSNITSLKNQVQSFQTSVKILKQSLIDLHKTLQQTVSIMKSANGDKQGSGPDSNTNTTGEDNNND